ncbi:MAG TPA: hypothetical protein VII57_01490 [Dehalococcoidia bacterium]
MPVPADAPTMRVVVDVKCYYCGHVSGQIIGRRNERLRLGNFIPRPGYQGPPPKPGDRLRCERCRGPVFLEDAAPAVVPSAAVDETLRRRVAARGSQAA